MARLNRVRFSIAALRGFTFASVPNDLIAGTMLAAIAIPEQLATARLAGMPAQTGLYAFAAGSVAFAIFGTNRYLSSGADSTIAPIFAGALASIAIGTSTPYPELVAVAACFTGIVLVVAGVLRAGWIADLLSIPVTTGFLAGIAVHIIVGQLPLILGVPSGSGPLLQTLITLLRHAPETNGTALLIGGGVLVSTLAADRINPRVPGALLGLVVSGIAVAVFHLRNVATLGALPSVLPGVRLVPISAHDAVQVAPVALIVALVCMVQTAVVVRSYPSVPGVVEDPSRDFAAIGIGSIASAIVGSFAVDASPPRTAVAVSSGGRSQLAGIVAVVAVVVLAIFGARLATFLPLAALGGVLVFIGIRLFRVGDMVRIAQAGSDEIWLVGAAALLVIVLPIEIGALLAIALSLVRGVYVVARPPSTELVRIAGTTIWWPPEKNVAGERVAGVLVFAPAAPLTFTNGEYIVGRLRHLIAAAAEPVRLVVIEGGGIIDIDYTGAALVRDAIDELRSRGVTVAVARLEDDRARRAAERTGLFDALGPGRQFESVQEALVALEKGT